MNKNMKEQLPWWKAKNAKPFFQVSLIHVELNYQGWGFYIALRVLTYTGCRQELQHVGAVPIHVPIPVPIPVGQSWDLMLLACLHVSPVRECVPLSRESCGVVALQGENGLCQTLVTQNLELCFEQSCIVFVRLQLKELAPVVSSHHSSGAPGGSVPAQGLHGGHQTPFKLVLCSPMFG